MDPNSGSNISNNISNNINNNINNNNTFNINMQQHRVVLPHLNVLPSLNAIPNNNNSLHSSPTQNAPSTANHLQQHPQQQQHYQMFPPPLQYIQSHSQYTSPHSSNPPSPALQQPQLLHLISPHHQHSQHPFTIYHHHQGSVPFIPIYPVQYYHDGSHPQPPPSLNTITSVGAVTTKNHVDTSNIEVVPSTTIATSTASMVKNKRKREPPINEKKTTDKKKSTNDNNINKNNNKKTKKNNNNSKESAIERKQRLEDGKLKYLREENEILEQEYADYMKEISSYRIRNHVLLDALMSVKSTLST